MLKSCRHFCEKMAFGCERMLEEKVYQYLFLKLAVCLWLQVLFTEDLN